MENQYMCNTFLYKKRNSKEMDFRFAILGLLFNFSGFHCGVFVDIMLLLCFTSLALTVDISVRVWFSPWSNNVGVDTKQSYVHAKVNRGFRQLSLLLLSSSYTSKRDFFVEFCKSGHRYIKCFFC